jgi:hypothetical protein
MIDFPKNWSSDIYLPEREKQYWDGKFPIGGLRNGARNLGALFDVTDEFRWSILLEISIFKLFLIFWKNWPSGHLAFWLRKILARRRDFISATAIWELHWYGNWTPQRTYSSIHSHCIEIRVKRRLSKLDAWKTLYTGSVQSVNNTLLRFKKSRFGTWRCTHS